MIKVQNLEDLSIEINLGGKTYPIQVKESEQEAIAMAADKLNQAFSDLSEKYAVKDSRDLMTMAALQVTTELLNGKVQVDNKKRKVLLEEIDKSLESLIS